MKKKKKIKKKKSNPWKNVSSIDIEAFDFLLGTEEDFKETLKTNDLKDLGVL